MPREGSHKLHAGDLTRNAIDGRNFVAHALQCDCPVIFQRTVLRPARSRAVQSSCYDSSVATTSPGT
jgi:hypothetical protein